ncbi:hypothetical protein NE237_016160 [Protea cynaroides]|uniref:Uncharacterized protein n=1 Tax=Protea cynaroides TaxID=273540 RepID=A0A9Q0KFP3_9MAGN|nr:hypothetical protein NE237_016160 [Protea cynaroides]
MSFSAKVSFSRKRRSHGVDNGQYVSLSVQHGMDRASFARLSEGAEAQSRGEMQNIKQNGIKLVKFGMNLRVRGVGHPADIGSAQVRPKLETSRIQQNGSNLERRIGQFDKIMRWWCAR